MLPLPFYTTLPEADRDLARAIAPKLGEDSWKRFQPVQSLVPRRTFDNIAEILAFTAPRANHILLARSVDFCMWMYLLDYYVDEDGACELGAVSVLHQRVAEAMAGTFIEDSPTPFLENTLIDLMREFRESKLGDVLAPVLQVEILAELKAVRTILELSRSDEKPAFRGFLEHARFGVNHISCTLSMLFAVGDDLEARHVEMVWPALVEAATCIRIANDLRTHSKDEAEGLLHSLSFGHDAAALKGIIADHWTACLEKLRNCTTDGFPVASAEAIRRITRIGLDMYSITDIRYEL